MFHICQPITSEKLLDWICILHWLYFYEPPNNQHCPRNSGLLDFDQINPTVNESHRKLSTIIKTKAAILTHFLLSQLSKLQTLIKNFSYKKIKASENSRWRGFCRHCCDEQRLAEKYCSRVDKCWSDTLLQGLGIWAGSSLYRTQRAHCIYQGSNNNRWFQWQASRRHSMIEVGLEDP